MHNLRHTIEESFERMYNTKPLSYQIDIREKLIKDMISGLESRGIAPADTHINNAIKESENKISKLKQEYTEKMQSEHDRSPTDSEMQAYIRHLMKEEDSATIIAGQQLPNIIPNIPLTPAQLQMNTTLYIIMFVLFMVVMIVLLFYYIKDENYSTSQYIGRST